MSEISPNSKSPRGLFQIRKKKKKIASKKILDQTFKNNEEQIMMEASRRCSASDIRAHRTCEHMMARINYD